MVDNSIVEYILFNYVGDFETESVPVVAMLTLLTFDDGTGKFTIYTRPAWDREYQQGEQLQLAKDILSDLEQVDSREALPIFQSLSEASNGPLRAMKSGKCLRSELNAILSEELQISL